MSGSEERTGVGGEALQVQCMFCLLKINSRIGISTKNLLIIYVSTITLTRIRIRYYKSRVPCLNVQWLTWWTIITTCIKLCQKKNHLVFAYSINCNSWCRLIAIQTQKLVMFSGIVLWCGNTVCNRYIHVHVLLYMYSSCGAKHLSKGIFWVQSSSSSMWWMYNVAHPLVLALSLGHSQSFLHSCKINLGDEATLPLHLCYM